MAKSSNKSRPAARRATWAATLATDGPSAQRIANLVAESFFADEVAVTLTDAGKGNWLVGVHFRKAPDKNALRSLVAAAASTKAAKAITFNRVAERDWVAESLAGLKPVAAGRFVVHGAHDRAGVPVGRIGIEIEASLAFGTGHHGTTRGCLLALDWLCRPLRQQHRGLRILDLGTGTGVLAIAAARALHRRVLAADIDPAAVLVAADNARLNRAGPMIEVLRANGLAAPVIRAGAPFDLVFANILLGPLQRLAAPLTRFVAPGGRVVLSGLLTAQANAARTAYRGFRLERCIELDGWTTLVLRKAPAC
jgi:ribosomal protein L11 methyltransferase